MIGGTDVSGFDDERGQHKVISMIIGPEEEVFKIHNKIGIKKIHMAHHTPAKRNHVKKHLVFDPSKILAISLVVGKGRIVHKIYDKYRAKGKFISRRTIYSEFDKILLDIIRPHIDQFLSGYNLKLSDVTFQSDPDMTKTLRNWNIKRAEPGKIHDIADALAFFCRSGHPVPHSKRYELESELEKHMGKKFRA